MTGPDPDAEASGTRPISVAELLARNGTVGAPAVTRRRRRRRGDSDTVTVAELTAEIPVIREQIREQTPAADAAPESVDTESQPDPRSDIPPDTPSDTPSDIPPDTPSDTPSDIAEQPKSPSAPGARDDPGRSGAERMSPDPVTPYAGTPVEVTDAEVRPDEPRTGPAIGTTPAGAGSPLWESDSTLYLGGQTLADELARRGGMDTTTEQAPEQATEQAGSLQGPRAARGRLDALWLGLVAVVQSVVAVLVGAGLFLAFDQLWRWNSIVALVLSVLVILGLVVGVRVVRKTEDIASTLIAVAVGALITLGPLALSLRSG